MELKRYLNSEAYEKFPLDKEVCLGCDVWELEEAHDALFAQLVEAKMRLVRLVKAGEEVHAICREIAICGCSVCKEFVDALAAAKEEEMKAIRIGDGGDGKDLLIKTLREELADARTAHEAFKRNWEAVSRVQAQLIADRRDELAEMRGRLAGVTEVLREIARSGPVFDARGTWSTRICNIANSALATLAAAEGGGTHEE